MRNDQPWRFKTPNLYGLESRSLLSVNKQQDDRKVGVAATVPTAHANRSSPHPPRYTSGICRFRVTCIAFDAVVPCGTGAGGRRLEDTRNTRRLPSLPDTTRAPVDGWKTADATLTTKFGRQVDSNAGQKRKFVGPAFVFFTLFGVERKLTFA